MSGQGTVRERAGRGALAWLLAVVCGALLVGCGAGVNEDLLATATAYPIRSPVGAGPAVGTPRPEVGGALATGEAALTADSEGVATARRRLDEAIATEPARAELYVARARLAARAGDHEAAVADFGLAIARDPGDPDAYVGRALALLATARGNDAAYRAAGDDGNRALTLDPSSLGARLIGPRVLVDRGEYRGDPADHERALAELDRFGAAGNDGAALLVRARALARQGDAEGARAALAAVAVESGTAVGGTVAGEGVRSVDVEVVRAVIALTAGEWDAAVAAATAALAADPTAWEAHRLLAEAELGRGEAEAALAALNRLPEPLPEDGPGLYLRGVALARSGQEEDARGALESARALLPSSPVYQARIAQALTGIGAG